MSAATLRLKSGRTVTHFAALEEMQRAQTALALWTRRAFMLAPHDDPELTEYNLERIEYELEHLSDLLGECRSELERRRAERRERDKIAQLRNVTGRTAPEAATALALADRLEHKHREAARA